VNQKSIPARELATNIMGKNIFAIGKYAINKKQNFVLKIKNKNN